jgi:Fe-S-cluster containining protein
MRRDATGARSPRRNHRPQDWRMGRVLPRLSPQPRVLERVMPTGTDRDLEALCKSCGLCCDGSLFGRVTLERGEVRVARTHHLRVLQREGDRRDAFEQPCSALSRRDEGCACAIYTERPRSCRSFTCRLYDQHRREGGPLEVRLEVVRRVRALLRLLETTTNEDARRAVVLELTQRTEEHFARVHPRGHDRPAAGVCTSETTHDRSDTFDR